MANCSNNIFPVGLRIKAVAVSIEEIAEQCAFWTPERLTLNHAAAPHALPPANIQSVTVPTGNP